ncbi:MAG: hypothetical protein RLZZ303_3421 [Candidatus Hydrogenedentota bacterium]|jgi:uncharacterized protein YyaL (SSP411 family)
MSQHQRGPRANALARETSPYLLQHAYNPVDWQPWGDAAIAQSRAEDKPIFLSIGYSACHWCHVMERESFENEQIAAYLNEHFVSIKVDREERPDLDDIYMAAVLALNGHGGWPMTVFLTPDLKPFYGGTYYPPVGRHGQPGFFSLLQGIQHAWAQRRDEVLQNAGQLADYVAAQLSATVPSREAFSPVALLDGMRSDLARSYDSHDGGWGSAPKFPSGMAIGLLLREHRRTGDPAALGMATHTLDRMAAGGLYDQLGGGFARYSVDGQWLVPHFEKMLYDNAQLSHAYIEAWQLTRKPRYAEVARETLDYVLRDLRDAGGAFHSAEDADSEGEEGKFYLWRKDEIISHLGAEDGERFCQAYNVRAEGNFDSHEPYHEGLNILHLGGASNLEPRLAPLRARLLEARGARVRPGLDDKVLTSWNGLMISSLALGAQAFQEARYAEAAREAALFFRERMWCNGALLRTHRQGESRLPGYLDDYAFLANGCVDLYEATFEPEWIEEACRLVKAMCAKFWDEEAGLFCFTSAEHQHLIARARPSHDGAEPSGNAVAALLLLRLAALLGDVELESLGRRVLSTCAPLASRAPRGYLKLGWALNWLAAPPVEIAVVSPHSHERDAMAEIGTRFIPNRVLAASLGEEAAPSITLLHGKIPGADGFNVYLCRNHTCEAPLSGLPALVAALESRYPWV